MAKKIKFNLICDTYPVRTIEDLQEHFAIEDVLYYYNGEDHLLHRWLELRGYHEELFKVMSINVREPQEIIKALARIFAVEIDEDDIDSYYRSESYRKERDQRNNIAANADLKIHAVLENYRLGYQEQILNLGSPDTKKQDFATEKLVSDYKWAFEMDLHNLIERVKSNSDIISILGLLRNAGTRSCLVDEKNFLKFDLGIWLRDFPKAVKNKIYSIKTKKIDCKSTMKLEEEGVFCIVIECPYSTLKTCDANSSRYIEGYSDDRYKKVYNGLKIKNESNWNAESVTYLTL